MHTYVLFHLDVGHRIGGTAKCLGNGSMVISLLFFALTLGVISLTYFTVSLQARIADISMALEPGKTHSLLEPIPKTPVAGKQICTYALVCCILNQSGFFLR